MKAAKYDWQMPKIEEPTPSFVEASEAYQLSPVLAQLLWNRGIKTKEALHRFIQPEMTDLHDPYLLYDMEKVIERLHEAVIAEEHIVIYGDYDADGITSTTVLKEALELIGADVETYLPNRFTDGYGPNVERYQDLIQKGAQLIVTVDNGVSGHEAIAYANSQGIDVIVTDHHELPSELPQAYGIIHPRHPKGAYPFKDLAGVGVAFKVACALLDDIPLELLDLVAIGTIADMVSLTDENRAMVIWGLQQIKQGARIGLNELLLICGEKISEVNEETIGFSIAPRLNAIGRLGDPNPAIDLMTTFDKNHAQELAEVFNQLNQQRKDLVEIATKEALQQIMPENKIHLLVGENWHEGILGIVAGRVMQETGQPAIALTHKEDGLLKGSGRSTAALNMFEMLEKSRELLATFGGHHAAVGLSLLKTNLPLLQEAINHYLLEEQIDLSKGLPLAIDGEMAIETVDLSLIQSLQRLAPYGMHNPIPQFVFKNVSVRESRSIGSEQKHLKFVLDNDKGHQVDGIGFGFGQDQSEFETENIHLVAQLTINEWNGHTIPQLRLQDYQVSTIQVFDFRGKKHHQQLDFTEETLFVAFSKKLYKVFKEKQKHPVIYVENIESFKELYVSEHSCSQLVVIDTPVVLDWVKVIIHETQISRVYILGLSSDEAYLEGLGSREQYAKLFKLIKGQDQLDVRHKLPAMATYTGIPVQLLIFMIQVFVELEFVTLENGLLKNIDEPVKRALTESEIYQARQRKIKNEEFLLLSDLAMIKNWICH